MMGRSSLSTGATVTPSTRSRPWTSTTVVERCSGMSKSCRHWTMLRLRPLACGMISNTPSTSHPFERQAPRHDEADVAGTQDDHPPTRQVAEQVDELLCEPGGHHAGGPRPGNADGAARALARPHGQHRGGGVNHLHPAVRRTSASPAGHGRCPTRRCRSRTSMSWSITCARKRCAYSGPVNSSLK